jgi:hypothetical protein
MKANEEDTDNDALAVVMADHRRIEWLGGPEGEALRLTADRVTAVRDLVIERGMSVRAAIDHLASVS